jgi:acetyltransferase
MFTSHYLREALVPKSIAVVGATTREDALGRYVFENITAGGFKGDLYPVNPKHDQIGEHKCYESIAKLPTKPDLVIIVTPARTVPNLINDAGARGVRAVLVLSGGFSEIGEEGKRLQDLMMARARAHGIRIIGPNCVGLARPEIGLNATFLRTPARAGSVALVSQSGAVLGALLDYAWTAGFGFSSVVSTGGGADVEFSEILDFLAIDPATRSILLYIEGVHDARAFMSSIRAAASFKPVIVLKVGRHISGSKAAMSHTGALVGDDAVFDVALKRVGAIRVRAYMQMFAAAETLAAGKLPRPGPGNRLAIVTNGGGPGVLAADSVTDNALELAKLAPETIEELNQLLPATWSHGNPVDIIGDASAERYAKALELVLKDPNNDGALMLFCPTVKMTSEESAKVLLPVVQASEKPVVSAWLGQHDAGLGRAVFEKAGMPALISPERGVEAFGFLAQYVRNRELRLQVPDPVVEEFQLNLDEARRIVERALITGRGTLNEKESKDLIAAFGIDTATTFFASSADEAASRAEKIGYPVALKVFAEGISHKSDVGGVLLSLTDAQQVRQAFETIATRVAERAPEAKFQGVLVQKMIVRPNGRELIIGLVRDPTFGPVISFGMGGIAVEVLRDSAVALPPLNHFLAKELISRTRVSRMLQDFRGLPAVDMEALINTLLKVSELACEMPCIHELDINPLLADEHGCVALDARIVLGDGPLAPEPTYSHLAIHPYPKNLARVTRLKGGRTVLMRPIRPEDAMALKRFVSRWSPRTIYLRFHAPLRELTIDRLIRFTTIDYDREIAFIAIDASGEQEEVRGVSRYTRNPDGTTCEFGIAVEDEWQGFGLGHALMQAVENCARERGLAEIVGYVLKENEEMCHLMVARTYEPNRDPDDPGIVRFAKRLQSPLGGI